MSRLRFKATPDNPTWTHRKGRKGGIKANATYDGKPTTKLVGPTNPEVLADGDEVEMDSFDTQWCLTYYPLNFEQVLPPKPKPKVTASWLRNQPPAPEGDSP